MKTTEADRKSLRLALLHDGGSSIVLDLLDDFDELAAELAQHRPVLDALAGLDDDGSTEEEAERFITFCRLSAGVSENVPRGEPLFTTEHLTKIAHALIARVAVEGDASIATDTILDDCFGAEQEVHEVFGYKQDWVRIPLEDCRDAWWFIREGNVVHGDDEHPYDAGGIRDGHCFVWEIYTHRFLPKWVYETPTHTMICVDTHVDGNKYLAIFDNTKRMPAVDSDGHVREN